MKPDVMLTTALLRLLEKQVENEAAERGRLSDFFQHAPEPYLITSADGTIREVNGAAANLIGARGTYLKGKPLATLIAAAARSDFRKQLRALREADEGGATRWRSKLRTRREVEVDVELSVRAIRDPASGGYAWLLRTL